VIVYTIAAGRESEPPMPHIDQRDPIHTNCACQYFD
jgi:hypothetical protein